MTLGDASNPAPRNRAERRAADRGRRRRKGIGVVTGASVLLGGVQVYAPSPAAADPADFVVTSEGDVTLVDGDVTLREALVSARSTPGRETITFHEDVDEVRLTGGQLNFGYNDDGVTIQGPGRGDLTIRPQATSNTGRIFYFADNNDSPVTVTGLTITGARTTMQGGAIHASDTELTLSDVALTDNRAREGGALQVLGSPLTITDSSITGNLGQEGGGLFTRDATVTLDRVEISGNSSSGANGGGAMFYSSEGTISDSTFHDNVGGWGGGIAISDNSGNWDIANTTLDDNESTTDGGAIVLYGGAASLRGVTVSGNTAGDQGGGVYAGSSAVDIELSTITGNVSDNATGGGVLARSSLSGQGVATLANTIVSGNTGGGDVRTYDQPGAAVPAEVTATYSLLGTVGNTAITTAGGNRIGEDPLLGALVDNGGETRTHLPGTSSPVRDAGDPAATGLPSTDQRGQARLVGSRVDIGSVELAAPPAATTTTVPPASGPVVLPTTTTTSTTAPPSSGPPSTTPPPTTPADAPPAPPSVSSGGGSSPVFVDEEGEVRQVPLPPSAPPNQVAAALALSPTESIAATADGRVFTTDPGDNHGGIPAGKKLNAPIVGIGVHWTRRPGAAAYVAAAEDEWEPTGYWLLGSDGGVFSFGTATFHGSTGAQALNAPIVGIMPTRTGDGYWLVASDGGVFSFGDASFLGSTGGMKLAERVVSMVPTPTGKGYLLIAADGGVFTFGDALFAGSGAGSGQRFVAAVATGTGKGYWLLTGDGKRMAFGDAA